MASNSYSLIYVGDGKLESKKSYALLFICASEGKLELVYLYSPY